MNKIIMITGANGGIGKDTARQLAMIAGTEKIYLACRNKDRAKAAKKDLEETTGKSIFEIVIMDVSNPDSVRSAVKALDGPIDALVMNAGGMGGKEPGKITPDGVTQLFAANVLGHVVLVDELLSAGKLKNVALYASSEAVRGVKKMGMKRPDLKTSSEDEIASIIDGSFFGQNMDAMEAYGYIKYVATLWMSSLAREHSNVRFISMSPGGTSGTAVMDDLSLVKKIMLKYIAMPIIMPMMGMAHKLEVGAKRFVDGINDGSLKSGVFYASKEKVLTGPIMDQSILFADLSNTKFQNNANAAIHRFIQ
ncbi:MAG: SDR family NAD(P)-dependent oxidoreductase [Flavobacteriales bacterium]|nr:SDR family NAD(P)-dependent oxidoreductase [Flavobacteriales bacterium]